MCSSFFRGGGGSSRLLGRLHTSTSLLCKPPLRRSFWFVSKPAFKMSSFSGTSAFSGQRASSSVRKFRPLCSSRLTNDEPNINASASMDVPELKGVIFDVDGTLCIPQTYMFAEMREVLGIRPQTDILTHIYNLPNESDREDAMSKIKAIEQTAMLKQQPQQGLVELMDWLREKGLNMGICTRNFSAPVQHLLSTFLPGHTFSPIITRSFRPPKPDPAGILHIARSWGLETKNGARECIMVGDSIDDITAGRLAGAVTVLLANDVNQHLVGHENTDWVVSRLDELIELLEKGGLEHQFE